MALISRGIRLKKSGWTTKFFQVDSSPLLEVFRAFSPGRLAGEILGAIKTCEGSSFNYNLSCAGPINSIFSATLDVREHPSSASQGRKMSKTTLTNRKKVCVCVGFLKLFKSRNVTFFTYNKYVCSEEVLHA